MTARWCRGDLTAWMHAMHTMMNRCLGSLALIALVSACGADDTATGRPVAPNNASSGDMTRPVDMAQPVDMTQPKEDMGSDQGAGADMTQPAAACQADADCSPPQLCLVNRADGTRVCGAPAGPGRPGDMCSSGGQCRSNLCINGACAAPCRSAGDCPNGFACAAQTIPLSNGQSVTLNACVESSSPCLTNSDCAAPQICVVNRAGDPIVRSCQAPVPGAGDLGARCAQDAECASALCLDGVCSRPCERPNDCSTTGSFLCQPATVTTGSGQQASLNVCRPRPADQCLSNSQCILPQQCVAQRGPREIDFKCGSPDPNGGSLGASCAQDADCRQGLCLAGACTVPCQGNGDCVASPGATCALREVTLQDNNKDTVQVCVPPVACDDKGDCRLNEECYVSRAQTGINLTCRPGNPSGGALGQVCQADSECASNLCHPSRFGRVCTTPCDDNSDCAAPGYECRSASVNDLGGRPSSVRICAPKDPPPCASQDQCPTGTTCAIVPNVPSTALESVCVPTTGRLATGVPCSGDDACASRVCLRGFCAAPCVDSTQCAAGQQVCKNNAITTQNLSGSFNVCEQLQDEDCTTTGRCSDGLRACSELRQVGQDLRLFCRLPNAAGAQLGSACTMNPQCREALCHPVSNECTAGCSVNSDCSALNGQICTTYRFNQTSDLSLCTQSCVDNASCNPGNVCTINANRRTNAIDQVCQAPVANGRDLGQTCSGGGECLTGICLTTQVFDPNGPSCVNASTCQAGQDCVCPIDQPGCVTGRRCAQVTSLCTRVCNDPSDCSGVAGNPLTACSTTVNVQRPNGGTQQVSMCARP